MGVCIEAPPAPHSACWRQPGCMQQAEAGWHLYCRAAAVVQEDGGRRIPGHDVPAHDALLCQQAHSRAALGRGCAQGQLALAWQQQLHDSCWAQSLWLLLSGQDWHAALSAGRCWVAGCQTSSPVARGRAGDADAVAWLACSCLGSGAVGRGGPSLPHMQQLQGAPWRHLSATLVSAQG